MATTDYRLFDIQHCVLPTRLPLEEFYRELILTQQVLNMKHLGWRTVRSTFGIIAGQLARGQTNFLKSLFRFNGVYNIDRLLADHAQTVRYHLQAQPASEDIADPRDLYILNRSDRGDNRRVGVS